MKVPTTTPLPARAPLIFRLTPKAAMMVSIAQKKRQRFLMFLKLPRATRQRGGEASSARLFHGGPEDQVPGAPLNEPVLQRLKCGRALIQQRTWLGRYSSEDSRGAATIAKTHPPPEQQLLPPPLPHK